MESKSPSHVVVLIHGIKTFGDWQTRLEALLRARDPAVQVVVYRYPYFLATAFLLPFLRWIVTRRFQAFLERLAGQTTDSIDIVSHSFGTYVATSALARLPDESRLKVNRVLLSGAVLRSHKKCARLLDQGRIRTVINDCGTKDIWPMVAQWIALGMGAVGRFGFTGPTGSDIGIVNRFFPFGHSGFFEASPAFPHDSDHFMREKWVPLLLDNQISVDDQIPVKAPFWMPLAVVLEPIKLTLLLSPIIAGWLFWAAISANELISRSEKVLNTDPVSAFMVALRADRLWHSQATRTALVKAVIEIRKREARRRAWDEDFDPPGLWGGNWHYMKTRVLSHPTKPFTLIAAEEGSTGHEVRLANSELDFSRVLNPVLERPNSAPRAVGSVGFSRSGDYVLIGRHAFIEIHNLNGERLATYKDWITKDQWVFLELLNEDEILLAVDQDGKVILFEFTRQKLVPLTREYQIKFPAAAITLDINATGDRFFFLHRNGYATWWAFDIDPKDKDARVNTNSFKKRERSLGYLVPLHLFGLPAVRVSELSQPIISFGPEPEEYIVWAGAHEWEGRTHFVTGFKYGDPSVWISKNDVVEHVSDLSHPESKLEFVGFGSEGNILTIDATVTARVFSANGKLIDSERLDPAELVLP